jgi:hypothetical protein
MLTTNSETPIVAKTTVGADFLQPLQIVTKLAVDAVGDDLRVLAICNISLSVEEPSGDLILSWILNDGHDAFEFFGGDLTRTV